LSSTGATIHLTHKPDMLAGHPKAPAADYWSDPPLWREQALLLGFIAWGLFLWLVLWRLFSFSPGEASLLTILLSLFLLTAVHEAGHLIVVAPPDLPPAVAPAL
jgi:hypothetical protein